MNTERNYPLLEDGSLDWEYIKQRELEKYDRLHYDESNNTGGQRKYRACNNAKRPKPRKKKR